MNLVQYYRMIINFFKLCYNNLQYGEYREQIIIGMYVAIKSVFFSQNLSPLTPAT